MSYEEVLRGNMNRAARQAHDVGRSYESRLRAEGEREAYRHSLQLMLGCGPDDPRLFGRDFYLYARDKQGETR